MKLKVKHKMKEQKMAINVYSSFDDVGISGFKESMSNDMTTDNQANESIEHSFFWFFFWFLKFLQFSFLLLLAAPGPKSR